MSQVQIKDAAGNVFEVEGPVQIMTQGSPISGAQVRPASFGVTEAEVPSAVVQDWPEFITSDFLERQGVGRAQANRLAPQPRSLSEAGLERCFSTRDGRSELAQLAELISNGSSIGGGATYAGLTRELNNAVDYGSTTTQQAATVLRQAIVNAPGSVTIR
jgi:hypothetical protein